MNEDEELPLLTDVGWHVVETIERGLHLQLPNSLICELLDISEDLMYLMLAKAEMERRELEQDIRDL